METSHHPIPFDQPYLVALHFLSAPLVVSWSAHDRPGSSVRSSSSVPCDHTHTMQNTARMIVARTTATPKTIPGCSESHRCNRRNVHVETTPPPPGFLACPAACPAAVPPAPLRALPYPILRGMSRPRYALLQAAQVGCRGAPGARAEGGASGGHRRGALGGCWGDALLGGRRQKGFEFPIRISIIHRTCTASRSPRSRTRRRLISSRWRR